MSKQSILLFLISLPNVALGAVILYSSRKVIANRYFAGFALSVGLWSLGLGGFLISNDLAFAYKLAQFYYIAASFIAPCFFAFALFSGMRSGSGASYLRKIGYILPVTVMSLVLVFIPSLVLETVELREWGKEVILNKLGYFVFTLYFTSYVIGGFNMIVKKIRHDGGRRGVDWYLLAGLVVAFFMGMVFNLILPFAGNYRHIWAGPLFTFAYVAMVSYSIVKKGLFDIRLVIARFFAYLVTLSLLVAVYGLLTGGVVAIVFGETINVSLRQLGYIIIAVMFGVSLLPVKRFFDRITNRFFYQDAYDGQDLLRQLNEVLITTIDIDKLLDKSSAIIKDTIRSEFCVFGLKAERGTKRRIIGHGTHNFSEEDITKVQSMTPKTGEKIIITDLLPAEFAELQEILRSNKVAVITRLTSSNDLTKPGMGYLVMGDKRSGNGYSSRDIDVLKIIADEYVIAIQNALRFEQIEQFGHTMERRVELATRELQKSNERLKALDETKDEFISMASHQLRTPLTSVKGYLSMVLEGDAGKISKSQRAMLDQAYVSSQRMVYLIADLLNVSRLRTGKFIIEVAPTDLVKVVKQEISQLSVTLNNHGLTLLFDPPTDIPLLNLDETKIRQVIMNFIDNAIYYTPNGGKITINLHQTEKSVELTVTDTGMGVPRSEQHQLFTKFFRAHNAKKARPDGTGLGLFMAKKVIIAQHGSVIFRSIEGKGSTFGFVFPKNLI